ncbi:PREDICTED: isoleucine--tRNA ligase, cytoplasmic [Bactrocera latifrons]|uniref:Isoleucine--tRNA ligase, cytoplasmic n=1 Tax=Bactrocera latifrons TaxID=174628 RepID=A0A0K8UH48_BACLA|nr:PREDICTED: isoleucine--tRNA ligase, cytoplasmic [Bactrocera latifrons]
MPSDSVTRDVAMERNDDIYRVPETMHFPTEELKILKIWRTEHTFERCMQLSKQRPRYTFYDGPPFATGLPHYGHILAGTIKDIVTRYAYQQGYHVERRFGWDCHGLPVEFEIDKLLNISGPEDVQEMGIAAYNAECRKIVMRYSNEWEEVVTRMGRWIDFRNDYKTLYPWYMESIWWVFKQLYDKGLVYEGVKVMPYSTACTTALSNFESGLNYKEVMDPCVVVAFEAVNMTNTYFLIWTTTPWTLPSNYACTVNPNLFYVKILDKKTNRYYILGQTRLNFLYKSEDDYEIITTFNGSSLINEPYKPPFTYFVEKGLAVNAFRILVDDYVTDDSGTGIVHNAPYFGEDDYRVCLNAGIIEKSSTPICPLDEVGRFTAEVTDFAGVFVKDADKLIIAKLKKLDVLVSTGQVKHSYPYCWRSDTPLIYRAVPSWFVRVEHMSRNLRECSAQTYWVPEGVRDGRFGNWLREARDWAISRNRYWGTPIPIWRSPSGDEVICVGSIEQLAALSGIHIKDLHRETVDEIEIPSAVPGNPPLRRISAVFDCWFESGSMPYAQQHFPFENQSNFMSNFPADFIAEGIDQTRGWFYTLLVISTALFNKAPYKNLIANGLVLAADGQKMSKSKKNYPDPMNVLHKYGADALRLYLINSPVVRAENLRFKEEGVRDIIKDVLLPLYNSYRFLLQNIARYEKEDLRNSSRYVYNKERHVSGQTNLLDVWIVSVKESLIGFFAKEMKLYHLYTVVPRLLKFIDQLTNWYIRLNRRRLRGEQGVADCLQSLDTLYSVLFDLIHLLAPFTPFLSEYIYLRLLPFQTNATKIPAAASVHHQMLPQANLKLVRLDIEKSMSLMQTIIELGRVIRDRRMTPLKCPLSEIIVIHRDPEILASVERLSDFILNELNVRKLTLSSDKSKYGVTLRAKPDHKILGQRFKANFKTMMNAIKSLDDEEIQNQLSKGYYSIQGHRIELSEVRLIYCVSENLKTNLEANSENDILVLLDMTPNAELLEEGLAREIINRIQKLKKKAKLIPTDEVVVFYRLSQESEHRASIEIKTVIEKYMNMITTTVKSALLLYNDEDKCKRNVIITELVTVKGVILVLTICSAEKHKTAEVESVNIMLADNLTPRFGGNRRTSLNLRNVETGEFITLTQLHAEIDMNFGLYGMSYKVYWFDEVQQQVRTLTANDLNKKLFGKQLVVALKESDVSRATFL